MAGLRLILVGRGSANRICMSPFRATAKALRLARAMNGRRYLGFPSDIS